LDLQGLFHEIRPKRNANLLVGIETSDDAAIYRINDEVALVITADYITPFTEDPFLYGQVAAANSLSDVYAMGGRPVTALNLCCFPVAAGKETLAKVLQGGLDKTEEAGAVLVGGHTVKDEEMKYGLSVNGLVHPKKYTPNSGARLGDKFILTKPVGSGVHITGARKGLIGGEDLLPVTKVMAELNNVACETMIEFEAGGATDITGFGLGGHTLSLARASKIGIRFFYEAIPRFPKTLDLIDRGVMTGLTTPNAQLVEGGIAFNNGFGPTEQGLFWDPQTSGGLFFGVRGKDAEACLKKLQERGVKDARIVGEAFATDKPHLEVVRG
jgi:selenide,water dikinase